MPRSSPHTLYCHTPGCAGMDGVEVRITRPHPAYDLDPPEVSRDDCPTCGMFLEDDRLEYEDAIDDLLDRLDLSERVQPSHYFDRRALLRVIGGEIDRQAIEARRTADFVNATRPRR